MLPLYRVLPTAPHGHGTGFCYGNTRYATVNLAMLVLLILYKIAVCIILKFKWNPNML